MHPLKVVEIKNPFGILQPTTQIPRDWVGIFLFQKNMFWWDTLLGNQLVVTLQEFNAGEAAFSGAT